MFYLGLDLGKRQDHSAVAVIERPEARWTPRGMTGGEGLLLRHVERVPLGTKYPDVVARIREIAGDPELRGRCALAVDATGVGNPVVDIIRGAGVGCNISEVTITGGDKQTQRGNWAWSVPKRDLMAGVQVALETNELKIAKSLRDAEALVQELIDMRVTVRATGRVRVGAEGAGEHDDLVIALALAVWLAKRPCPGQNTYSGMGIF